MQVPKYNLYVDGIGVAMLVVTLRFKTKPGHQYFKAKGNNLLSVKKA